MTNAAVTQHNELRPVKLSPSMMCADILNMREEMDLLMQEKIDMLHIDIMDGKYVPNFTLNQDIGYTLSAYSGIPLDFHLMVEKVDQVCDLFTRQAGSYVTFHPETSWHPVRTIGKIKESGCKASIAIDPAMSLESVKHLLPLVDMVCVMTVNPGFSGQKLIPFCLDKIQQLLLWKKENQSELLIEVDGNVSWENIPKMVDAGAEVLVLGTSSVFTSQQSRQDAFQKLNNMLSPA